MASDALHRPYRRLSWICRNLPEVFSIGFIRIFQINLSDYEHQSHHGAESAEYHWSRATASHMATIENDAELSPNLEPGSIPRYTSCGNRLYVAEDNDTRRIVAYIACQLRTKRMGTYREFVLMENECFIAPYFTRPQWRGVGCVTTGMQFVILEMKKAGRTTAYVDIASSNHSSIRVVEKHGAKGISSWYLVVRIWRQDHVLAFGPLRSRFQRISKEHEAN